MGRYCSALRQRRYGGAFQNSRRDRLKPGGGRRRKGRPAHPSVRVRSRWRVPFITAHRTLSIKCAPRGIQRICRCAFIRRCNGHCTVLSVTSVQIGSSRLLAVAESANRRSFRPPVGGRRDSRLCCGRPVLTSRADSQPSRVQDSECVAGPAILGGKMPREMACTRPVMTYDARRFHDAVRDALYATMTISIRASRIPYLPPQPGDRRLNAP